MEMILNEGFCAMSQNEMQEVDGGMGAVIAFTLGFITGVAITVDLRNCYYNGYNEVMYGEV